MSLTRKEMLDIIANAKLNAFKKSNLRTVDGCRNCKHSYDWNVTGIGYCRLLEGLSVNFIDNIEVLGFKRIKVNVDTLGICDEWEF